MIPAGNQIEKRKKTVFPVGKFEKFRIADYFNEIDATVQAVAASLSGADGLPNTQTAKG